VASVNLTVSTNEVEKEIDRASFRVKLDDPDPARTHNISAGAESRAGVGDVIGFAVVAAILGLCIYFAWIYLI